MVSRERRQVRSRSPSFRPITTTPTSATSRSVCLRLRLILEYARMVTNPEFSGCQWVCRDAPEVRIVTPGGATLPLHHTASHPKDRTRRMARLIIWAVILSCAIGLYWHLKRYGARSFHAGWVYVMLLAPCWFRV